MNELEVLMKKIADIEYRLNRIEHPDRYQFMKDIELFDGMNFKVGTGSGTRIGTSSTQKLALWGKTPIVQPSTIAALSATGSDQDATARTAINSILTALKNVGIIAT